MADTMTVKMPDGTLVENVPRGTTKTELMRRLNKLKAHLAKQNSTEETSDPLDLDARLAAVRASLTEPEAPPVVPVSAPAAQSVSGPISLTPGASGTLTPNVAATPPAPAPSFAEAMIRQAPQTLLDNIVGAPNAIARRLMPRPIQPGQIPDPLQLLAAGINSLTGGRINPTRAAQDVRATGSGPLPLPTGLDVRAGTEAVLTGRTFDQAKASQALADQRFAIEEPVGTAVGGVLGDVATVLMGRAPVAPAIRNARLAADARHIAKTESILKMEPTVRRTVQRALNSNASRAFRRGIGKAGEASLEAGALQIIKGNDPFETAAFAAGTQMAGSLGLSTIMRGGRLSPSKIAITAATLFALNRLGQEFGPGENSSWSAVDETFGAMKWALLLGAFGGLVGAGRLRGEFGKELPAVADAITAVPRAAVQSFLGQMANPGARALVGPVVKKLAEDPLFFGAEARKRLDKAMQDGTLPRTINELLKDREFRKRFELLRG